MFCPNCGAPIETDGARFCGNCGESLDGVSVTIENSYCYDDEYDNMREVGSDEDNHSGHDKSMFVRPEQQLQNDEREGFRVSDHDQSEEYAEGQMEPVSLLDRIQSIDRHTKKVILVCTAILATFAVLISVLRNITDSGSATQKAHGSIENTNGQGAGGSTATENETHDTKFKEAEKALLAKADSFPCNYTPCNYSWRVPPEIEADDIQMVVRERPTFDNGKFDYNSVGKYKYDRTMSICLGDKYGLIAYNGLPLSDVFFTSVSAWSDMQYLLERPDKEIYYTINDKYEQIRLSDRSEAERIRGDYENTKLIWSEADECLFDSKSCSSVSYYKASAAWYVDDLSSNTVYCKYRILVKDRHPIDWVLFEDAGCFCDGVIPAKLNGKWGYVDENMNVVLPFEFEETYRGKAYNVTGRLIVVKKNDKYALFDLDGNMLIDYDQFEEIRPAYQNMVWVKQNGRWGVIGIVDDALDIIATEPANYLYNSIHSRINTSDGLRLRQSPTTDSSVLGILSNHREVELLAIQGEWAFINVRNSTSGWVKKEYIIS